MPASRPRSSRTRRNAPLPATPSRRTPLPLPPSRPAPPLPPCSASSSKGIAPPRAPGPPGSSRTPPASAPRSGISPSAPPSPSRCRPPSRRRFPPRLPPAPPPRPPPPVISHNPPVPGNTSAHSLSARTPSPGPPPPPPPRPLSGSPAGTPCSPLPLLSLGEARFQDIPQYCRHFAQRPELRLLPLLLHVRRPAVDGRGTYDGLPVLSFVATEVAQLSPQPAQHAFCYCHNSLF